MSQLGLDYVTLGFFRGNGDFTFEPSIGIPLASRREWEPSAGTAVDLNGDGLRDLAVASTFGVTTVLLNQGQFSFNRTDIQGGHGTSTDVTARDVNDDGKVDLLTSGRFSDTGERPWTDGYAAVALGNGDGTFAPAVEYVTLRDIYAKSDLVPATKDRVNTSLNRIWRLNRDNYFEAFEE